MQSSVPAHNISFLDFKLNCFHALQEWRPILSIPYLFMLFLSTTSNSTLIYLIISQRTLHSPMCILIGLMAFVDLSLPVFFVPNMLFSLLFNWNGISLSCCLIQMFFLLIFGTFQSTILLWMALDRYFAICRPMHYHKYMRMPNFLKFIIFPVIRNVIFIVMTVIWAGKLSFCATNEIEHCFCEHMALVQLACGETSANSILGLVALFVITTADFLIITVSYLIILFSVLKSGKANFKAFNTCITHIIVMTVTIIFALIAFLSAVLTQLFME